MEIADWILEDAIESARTDGEWEREVEDDRKKAGDIRISVNVEQGRPVGFRAQGAGVLHAYGKMGSMASGVDMTIYEGVPTATSKDLSEHDIYEVRTASSGIEAFTLFAQSKPIFA